MRTKAHIGVKGNEILDKLSKYRVKNGQQQISCIPFFKFIAEKISFMKNGKVDTLWYIQPH